MFENEDYDEVDSCPSCGNEQRHAESVMGQLGNRMWHRCRFCGWEWSRPATMIDPKVALAYTNHLLADEE